MPNPKHEQLDFRGLELLVDEVTASGSLNGSINTGVAPVTITATTGTLPTPNGAVTIANAATPTVVELLEAVVELNAKIAALQ